MGPPPVVTGISPKEAAAGMKLTIRGENLGVSHQDIMGVLVHGADCTMTVEWKSPNKLIALCPGAAKEGKGEIIVATRSGGLGTCTVQLVVFKETIGPLKEVAVWTQEKSYARRKHRFFSPTAGGVEQDDALGLSVEGNELKMPEEKLQQMFPGKCGDIGADNFDPAYYLVENHHGTALEDLQAGLGYLRRKVDGENESQLSFIKGNISSIMDQMDTLRGIKKRYEIDNKQYGHDPTVKLESAISAAKKEADQMFVDVLGRKDRADSTRNAISVLNRFKFLFNLPANIEANLVKSDFDRIIDEYERAKSLYGDSDCEIFQIYLEEIEKGILIVKELLRQKLQNPDQSVELQKKVIANLVQLKVEEDPAWECLQTKYQHVISLLEACRDDHMERQNLVMQQQQQTEDHNHFPISPIKNPLFPDQHEKELIPHSVLFVEEAAQLLCKEFPNLWKIGQAYFKGDLVVQPDLVKQSVFKDMILGGMRRFSNMIRAAIIPQTMKEGENREYGQWNRLEASEDLAKSIQSVNGSISAIQSYQLLQLPSCLRYVRQSYSSLIKLDLPGQALDIVKKLITDLRVECLQMIFQTVIDQAHVLHEREEWKMDVTDDIGAITELPGLFESLVTQSVQLIKEALLSADDREDNILAHHNAHDDLEVLIQNVLSSFAFALENAAIDDYQGRQNGTSSFVPSDSLRLLLCLNNCQITQTQILPKIQKSFQEVGGLSLEKPIAEACKCYNILYGKLFEAYLEHKCDSIVSVIEPSMYEGKFDWARCPRPADASDYVKEIIHNVVAVHSEMDRISSLSRTNYIETMLPRVVEAVAEEVNRLFCCVNRMNSNGCIQAWVDIHCLQSTLKPFLNPAANTYLTDAAKPLYDLERPGDREIVEDCASTFNSRMNVYVSSLQV